MKALLLFATVALSLSAHARIDETVCAEALASKPVPTIKNVPVSMEFHGQRIPIVLALVDSRASGGALDSAKVSTRIYAGSDWSADFIAELVDALIHEVRPLTASQTIIGSSVVFDRPVHKNDLVNVNIDLGSSLSIWGQQQVITVEATNAEDIPLFHAVGLIN